MVHARPSTASAVDAPSSATPEPRRVLWLSGAASAVAARMDLRDHPDGIVAHCETGAEDADTDRFIVDCGRWLNREIVRLRSTEFSDTWAVWEKRRYMSGIAGAPCTAELKITPRLAFQRPDDVHVFGYTADRTDVERAQHFRQNYPATTMETPLIDAGLTKASCLAMIIDAGLMPPRVYALGFHNANCVPCVKATSPDYWSLVRREFPEQFDRAAKLSREIGCRLARINDVRVFIDEIPADWPVTNPIAPACDFLCHIQGLAA